MVTITFFKLPTFMIFSQNQELLLYPLHFMALVGPAELAVTIRLNQSYKCYTLLLFELFTLIVIYRILLLPKLTEMVYIINNNKIISNN